MGSYTIITEVGNALVRLFRKELVPELIANSDAVGLATPADRGDLVLCIHLYDISESEDYRQTGMISDGMNRQKYPPIYLTLSYMITVFSASDVKFRAQEEHRILGRVMQVLRDYPILNPETMEFMTGTGKDGMKIELRKMELEEKQKLWNFPNIASKVSLFYKIGMVPLESTKTREIQRVSSIEFTD